MSGAAAAAGPPPEGAGTLPSPSRLPRPWLDAYPPGVPPSYAYPPVALPRLLDDAARDFPQVVAIATETTSLTYAEVRDLAERATGAFRGLGVGPGDVVGLALPNGASVPLAAFGAWRAGAAVLPIPPTIGGPEVVRRLAVTGARVAVVSPDVAEELERARDVLPGLEQVVAVLPDEWDDRRTTRVRRAVRRRRGRSVPGLREVLESSAPTPAVALGSSDRALVAFTAGRTATPRRVAFDHGNVIAAAFQSRLWVPDVQAGRERVLLASSLARLLGLTASMLGGVLAASTLVLPTDLRPKALGAAIARWEATLLHATPDVYAGLVDGAAESQLVTLRACLSVTAPLPADVAAAFERHSGGARVREAFGLTEAGGLTHANPIYGRTWRGSIGLPLTDTVAAVVAVDDPTRLLPAGEVGRIVVSGPQVARELEAGSDVALRDGWLYTSDLGAMAEDGSFTHHGRVARPLEEHP